MSSDTERGDNLVFALHGPKSGRLTHSPTMHSDPVRKCTNLTTSMAWQWAGGHFPVTTVRHLLKALTSVFLISARNASSVLERKL